MELAKPDESRLAEIVVFEGAEGGNMCDCGDDDHGISLVGRSARLWLTIGLAAIGRAGNEVGHLYSRSR